jgi:hypothetical protein
VQVQGVLEDGVLVQAQQRVLEREQQHEELERVPAQVPELVREPGRRHSLWLRWRGSKKSFSSIRRRSFSKPHQQSCANC